MQLDLPTLMVMQSFALACAGAVLLVAWSQNRKIIPWALWGVADIIAAGGILSLMLGYTSHQPVWFIAGGVLMPLHAGLMWKAARIIDSKSAPLVVVFLGPAVVGLGYFVPVLRDAAGSLSLTMGAAYFLAIAISLARGQKERLMARVPLVIFTAVQATFYLIGTYSTFSGSTGQEGVPSIMSLFGLIYFESIIFALGTSVFILALVKERNEAAGMAAARTDSLTGIANRAAFMESAQRVLERCRHDNAPVSVMMFDLDRFKSVNDRHGHAVGDSVLRKFCEVAAAALRPTDVFGRLGGEEFAVVLPGSSIEAAHARAERIRSSFAASCRFIDKEHVDATVSCGLAVSLKAEETLNALLKESDTALYLAKAEGRNRVQRAGRHKPTGDRPNVIRVA
ncbi:MAG: GGDEF domain-containing protein [Xanthobacteraceae bacterium]|nr:GGDEF domain-containing protein [Xanthobacteraceae bacterium]